MAKLNRLMVVKGSIYTIEYAVRADGSRPAKTFMDLLKEGMWRDDPHQDDFPSDEQISDWASLLNHMKYFASHGECQRPKQMNALEEGLWEFKAATQRLTFFDTPGDGTYEAKFKITDRAESPDPDSENYWWVPEFDDYLRLANFWPKVGDMADPLDIAEGLKIREEDIEYDR